MEAAVVDLSILREGFAPRLIRTTIDDVGVVVLTSARERIGRVVAAGRPVPGAVVIAIGPRNAEWITTTAADGSYRIPDPDSWVQSLTVLHSDHALRTFSRSRPDDPRISLDLTLLPGVTLKGSVVHGSGAAVADAQIRVDRWLRATTREDGTFELVHTTGDRSSIEVTHAGGIGGAGADANTIRLEPAAAVAGTVRDDRRQRGLEGVEVSLRDESGRICCSSITDAEGVWRIDSVRAGSYVLETQRPGFAATASTVRLQSGTTKQTELRSSALGRVSGQIVDERGDPLSFVEVLSMEGGTATHANVPLGAAGVSGPDGRYVLLDIRPASPLRLIALKRGFEQFQSESFSLTPGERRTQDIVLRRGVEVVGRVHDVLGRPVSGASVRIRLHDEAAPAGQWPEELKTDARGEFSLFLPRGIYSARIASAGFASQTLDPIAVSDALETLAITLEPAVTLTGRVRRSGQGIEGVTVQLLDDEAVAPTLTGGDGTFRLEGVAPGEATLSFRNDRENIDEIRVVRAPGDVLLEIEAGSSVSGRVIDAFTRQPVRAFDIGVVRDDRLIPAQQHFDSPDGTFVIPNVRRGAARLEVTAEGYAKTGSPPLTIGDGPLDEIEIGLQREAVLYGTVTTAQGAAVPGAQIDVRRGDYEAVFSDTTDALGHYAIRGLAPGGAVLTVNADDYLPIQEVVSLSGPSTVHDVTLSPGVELTGQIVARGVAMEGAAVSVTPLAGGRTATTTSDRDGRFRFAGLPAGRYRITASGQGFAPSRPREVDIPSPVVILIPLERGGVLTGRISGMPAGAEVIVVANSGWSNAVRTVDRTGAFRIEDLPAGPATVFAHADREGSVRSTTAVVIDVVAGGETSVELKFESR